MGFRAGPEQLAPFDQPFGRYRTTCDFVRPRPTKNGLASAALGLTSTEARPSSTDRGLGSTKIKIASAGIGLDSGGCSARFDDIGELCRPHLVLSRPDPGRCRPTLGQYRPTLGRCRPTLSRVQSIGFDTSVLGSTNRGWLRQSWGPTNFDREPTELGLDRTECGAMSATLGKGPGPQMTDLVVDSANSH